MTLYNKASFCWYSAVTDFLQHLQQEEQTDSLAQNGPPLTTVVQPVRRNQQSFLEFKNITLYNARAHRASQYRDISQKENN